MMTLVGMYRYRLYSVTCCSFERIRYSSPFFEAEEKEEEEEEEERKKIITITT